MGMVFAFNLSSCQQRANNVYLFETIVIDEVAGSFDLVLLLDVL